MNLCMMVYAPLVTLVGWFVYWPSYYINDSKMSSYPPEYFTEARLLEACDKGDLVFVNQYLEQKPSLPLNWTGAEGETILHRCIKTCHANVFVRLLDVIIPNDPAIRSKVINMVDSQNRTLLFCASSSTKRGRHVTELISRGADPTICNDSERFPLMVMLDSNNFERIDYMLSQWPFRNDRDWQILAAKHWSTLMQKHVTPMELAEHLGENDVLEALRHAIEAVKFRVDNAKNRHVSA